MFVVQSAVELKSVNPNRCIVRWGVAAGAAVVLLGTLACAKPAPPLAAPRALPVQTQTITLSSVPQRDTYVSTIKSRRSSTMQPQVAGNLTKILVQSGQKVSAGQILMQIDPLKQSAAVQQGIGAELQQKSVYQYNQAEVQRQKQLFEAGVTSKQVYDQAVQSFGNAQGAYNASVAQTGTQRAQLAYYQIRAPFAGIVGDIPVHQGDYVSPATLLTTVDENKDLEAYIYVPTERSGLVRTGLSVELLDTAGKTLATSTLNFVSPQVDPGTQSILAKAPIPASSALRNQQIVTARITWSSSPAPLVPVLAISRVGGAAFVFVVAPRGNGYFAHQVGIQVGDTLGNNYPVTAGLRPGDRVIVSGLQFLQEGAPVMPIPSGPPPAGSAPPQA